MFIFNQNQGVLNGCLTFQKQYFRPAFIEILCCITCVQSPAAVADLGMGNMGDRILLGAARGDGAKNKKSPLVKALRYDLLYASVLIKSANPRIKTIGTMRRETGVTAFCAEVSDTQRVLQVICNMMMMMLLSLSMAIKQKGGIKNQGLHNINSRP